MMTRESERSPFNASPAKRTLCSMAHNSSNSTTPIFNHTPPPVRSSLGRSSNSLKGPVTISSSLKVRSPRAPRPTILPSKHGVFAQSYSSDINNVKVSPHCQLHTELRYDAKDVRQIQQTVFPTSPTKTVKFASDTSNIESDPAILFCAVKSAKE